MKCTCDFFLDSAVNNITYFAKLGRQQRSNYSQSILRITYSTFVKYCCEVKEKNGLLEFFVKRTSLYIELRPEDHSNTSV